MVRIADYVPQSFDGGRTYIVRSPSTGDVIYDGDFPAKFDDYADAKEDADYQNKNAASKILERITDRLSWR